MLRVLVYSPNASERYTSLLSTRARQLGLSVMASGDLGAVTGGLPDAQILIAPNTFPVETLAMASSLRWIHVQGAGVDRWTGSEVPNGVRISRTVGTFGARMAEYALAHILAIHQHIHDFRSDQRDRRWRQRTPVPLAGTRLGVAGFGSIGATVAERASSFGMEVVGFARHGRDVGPFRVYGEDRFADFLEGLDWVVNVLPLTPTTRKVFNGAAFDAMARHAWFLNMGRGGTVEQVALVERLERGSLGGAVLDVFEVEPLTDKHPLWHLPNVVMTPHIAGVTRPEEVVDAFCANLSRFHDGTQLIDEIDRSRSY